MSTIYLKYLNNRIRLQRVFLVISSICICMGCEFYFDLKPMFHYHQYLLHQHQMNQLELIENRTLFSQEKTIDEAILKSQQTLGRYFRLECPNIISAELLTQIERSSELAGFMNPVIAPGLWKAAQGVRILTIRFKAEGELSQFLNFMRFLQNGSLPIILCDCALNKDKNSIFQINLQLAGFYVPASQEDLSFLKSNFPAIFSEHKNQEFSRVQISFQQMKMSGFVYDENNFWAVLKLPNGNSIAVSRNDLVGTEKARVLSINENQIVLQSQNQQFVLKNSL